MYAVAVYSINNHINNYFNVSLIPQRILLFAKILIRRSRLTVFAGLTCTLTGIAAQFTLNV